MASKWDKYTFKDQYAESSPFTLSTNLTAGKIEPWNLGTNPGMPSGGTYGGFPDRDTRRLIPTLGYSSYRDIMGEVLGIWGWRKALAEGECPKSQQIHEMTFVPLARETGEGLIRHEGRPRYCGYISRAECLEHFIVPLFDTKGGCQYTHCEDTPGGVSICNVRMQRPPRIVIRHTRASNDTERFVTDICLGSNVYYIGTDNVLEKAVTRAKRLVGDIMLMPEELPEVARDALGRDYYGLVFGEALPLKEQMILSDYWMALRISSWDNGYKAAALLEDQRRSLWVCPEASMHKALWNQLSVESCYGRHDYDKAQKGMRMLIPLLTGKYTKAVGNIFKKALTISKEEYMRKQLDNGGFCEFWP